MKIYVFFLIITCTLFRTNGQNMPFLDELPKAPMEREVYNNGIMNRKKLNLKTKIFWGYELLHGTVSTNKYKEWELMYDRNGLLTEAVQTNKNNTILFIYSIIYNQQNLLDEVLQQLPTGIKLSSTKFRYTPTGCISSIEKFNQKNNLIYKTVYLFSGKECKVKEKNYFAPDSLDYSMEYTYKNCNTGLISTIKRINSDSTQLKKIIEYINENQKDKELFYDSTGNYLYNYVYNYEKMGANTNEVFREMPNNIRTKKYIYKYDNNKNLTGFIEFDNRENIIIYYKYSYEKY